MAVFKRAYNDLWCEWLISSPKSFTASGNMRSPGYAQAIRWLSQIWAEFSCELLSNSFKHCGLTPHHPDELHTMLHKLVVERVLAHHYIDDDSGDEISGFDNMDQIEEDSDSDESDHDDETEDEEAEGTQTANNEEEAEEEDTEGEDDETEEEDTEGEDDETEEEDTEGEDEDMPEKEDEIDTSLEGSSTRYSQAQSQASEVPTEVLFSSQASSTLYIITNGPFDTSDAEIDE